MKDFLRSPWRAATVLLLAALFLTNIYRAATQSVAHDEGVIYEWLLGGSWSRVLSFEHGNHHVLSDVLCKLFLSIFGTSDFVYRIPALLGGLLYFYSAFSISTLLFGETYLLFVSTAFLTLNPFVLDYLVLARGYGPALGCFFYGLDRLAHYLTGMRDAGALRLLNKAGVGLGLSIGFNIIMIFPGVALVVSLLAILIANSMLQPAPEPVRATPASRKERRAGRKREFEPRSSAGFSQALLHFVLPAAAIGGFASMLPNRLIELEVGYLGPASLFAIVEGLARYSLFHSPFGFGGLVAWLPAATVVKGVTYFVVPLAFLATLVVAARVFAEWRSSRNLTSLDPGGPLLLLLAGLFPIAILSIVASRYLFEEPYPELRTAMYWIPLLSLGALCILARYAKRGAGTTLVRGIRSAGVPVCHSIRDSVQHPLLCRMVLLRRGQGHDANRPRRARLDAGGARPHWCDVAARAGHQFLPRGVGVELDRPGIPRESEWRLRLLLSRVRRHRAGEQPAPQATAFGPALENGAGQTARALMT